MVKKIFIIVPVIIILGLMFAAIFISRKNREQAQTTKVSASDNVVQEMPQHPVFPDAVLEKTDKKVESGKAGFEAAYSIQSSPQEAIVWYRSEIIRQGWTIYDESVSGAVTDLYIRARKGSELMNIFSEAEDGKTEVTIEYPLQ